MSQNEIKVSIIKDLKVFSVFTVIALLCPIFTLIVSCFMESDKIHEWFARSGSAMIVFALLAEARAINIFQILNPAGMGSVELNEAKQIYDGYPRWLNIVSFTFMATGTLIWGYGDIFIKCITNLGR